MENSGIWQSTSISLGFGLNPHYGLHNGILETHIFTGKSRIIYNIAKLFYKFQLVTRSIFHLDNYFTFF